jgi:hypothetical protein
MLIREGNKVRWNDGPLCDTEAEALKTAKPTQCNDEQAFVMDSASVPSLDDEFVDLEDT